MRVKDNKKSEHSEEPKKRSRPEVSDYDPVPLYRSYGVTRREYPIINKIKTMLHRITAALILVPMCVVLILGLVATILFGEVFAVVVYTPICIFIIFRLVRPQRKRRAFMRKLKKLAKKEGYKLSVKRGFWSSFAWSPTEESFILDTPKYSYHIHFFTARKYNSEIRFEEKNRFLFIKRPIKNVFSLMFDFKTKIKEYSFSPDFSFPWKNRKKIVGILVNPVCEAMSYREQDGTVAPTGSGGEVFGFYVFTATGFIESVKRNEELN